MFFLRTVTAVFRVPADDPDLIISQYRAIARQVPLLYCILILNTLSLAATHFASSPTLLTVVLPAGLVVAFVCRLIAWGHRNSSQVDFAQALRALRRLIGIVSLLGCACLAWALSLYGYGGAFEQAHTACFLSVASLACIFCLMHLRAAVLMTVLTVAAPSTLFFAATGKPVLIAISVNFALVAICMILVTFRHYQDFVALSVSRREIIERQGETQRLSDETSRLAFTDTLTGLSNRRAFFRDLDAALGQQQSAEAAIAIGLIDLDGFKPINDVFGHAVGDAVLHEVGSRMSALSDANRHFSRLGGDEFGFVLTGMSECEIEDFARALCQRLRSPYVTPTATAELSASIGIATFPRAGRTASLLLERADYALYYAKQNRRGMPVLFSHAHQSELRAAARLEQTLRHADLEAELSLAFQPIFDSETGRTAAFECLARWTSTDLGVVPPIDFIKAAERSDLINRLTKVLLRKALAAARTWPTHVRVAFNLSARDIASEEAVRSIGDIVREGGVDPARIDLEITETAVMRDFDQSREALLSLKALGVRLALDDFGTGYSSLSYVHRLPFDKIKVDRSFTSEVETDAACLNIVKTVLDLSRNLELDCVVEGLETASQVRLLEKLGCVLMQGYFFARPMRAEQVPTFLEAEAVEAGAARGGDPPAMARVKRSPSRVAS